MTAIVPEKIHLPKHGTSPSEKGSILPVKFAVLELADTTDTNDTCAFDLGRAGITKLWGISGYVHTTTDDVMTAEEPTTSVTGTILSIVIGGTAVYNKKRTYVLWGD